MHPLSLLSFYISGYNNLCPLNVFKLGTYNLRRTTKYDVVHLVIVDSMQNAEALCEELSTPQDLIHCPIDGLAFDFKTLSRLAQWLQGAPAPRLQNKTESRRLSPGSPLSLFLFVPSEMNLLPFLHFSHRCTV